MVLSDSRWQDWPYTGRSTGAYNVFYQGGPIDHWTHVPGPVAQYSAEMEHNTVLTAAKALAHFRMINIGLFNKDTDVVTEQEYLIIMDIKSAICMDKYNKEIKQTINISRRMHFVRNGEKWNFHKTMWCERVMKLADIVTNNIS